MELGAANMVEGPRQYLPVELGEREGGEQNTSGPSSEAGATTAPSAPSMPEAPSATSAGTRDASSNHHPAVSVAMGTTPNPLSYWPPPSSGSPLHQKTNNQKDSQPPPAVAEPVFRGQTMSWTSSEGGKCGNAVTEPPSRTSFHNLPPIAALTSSINYRGSSVQKQFSSIDNSAKIMSSKQAVMDSRIREEAASGEHVRPQERSVAAPSPAGVPPPPEQPSHRQERPVAPGDSAQQDHVFSVPSALANRTLPSPRAPTPFVASASPQHEALTISVNMTGANLSAGSPSPSRATSRLPTPNNYGSPSPDSPAPSRMLPSPHSSAPSPSNHRIPCSPHPVSSSPSIPPPEANSNCFPSPHAVPTSHASQSPSPSHSLPRFSTSPYGPYPSQQPPSPYAMNPSSVTLPSSSSSQRPIPTRPVVDAPHMSRLGHAVRPAPPQQPSSSSSHTTVHMSAPRMSSSSDTHSCQNPFELPAPKTSYPQHQYSNYHGNMRSPSENKQESHYPAMATGKEHERSVLASNYYPPSFGQAHKNNVEREMESPFRRLPSSHNVQTKPMQGYPSQYETYSTPSNIHVRGGPHPRGDDFVNYTKQAELQATRHEPGLWSQMHTPSESKTNDKSPYLSVDGSTGKGQAPGYNHGNMNDYSSQRLPTGMVFQGSTKPPASHPPNSYSSSSDPPKVTSQPNQSFSQRFPPVPQSNYDLNRRISERMTGVNQPVQPPRSVEKRPAVPAAPPAPAAPAAYPTASQMNKSHSYYRDYPTAPTSDHDKAKSYSQQAVMKQTDYQSRAVPPRSGATYPYTAPSRPVEGMKTVQPEAFQSKRVPANSAHPVAGHGYSTYPSYESHHQRYHADNHTDHHNPYGQNYSHSNNSHHQQTPFQSHRPVQPDHPSLYHQKSGSNYEPKRIAEEPKPRTFAPPVSHDLTTSHTQMKAKPPPPGTLSSMRPKRESPLDLSVKTVRQSADSTAKDEGDVYMHQSIRNFLQPPSHAAPEKQDYRYPAPPQHTNHRLAGAPKIDFTPNFAGFHSESQRAAAAAAAVQAQRTEASLLPPVDSFKKFPTKAPPPMGQGLAAPSKYSNPPNSLSNHRPPEGRYEQSHAVHKYSAMDGAKRPSTDASRSHSSQPKIPKVDTWKLVMDQQIEQRLNSARPPQQSFDRPVNGTDSSKGGHIVQPSGYPSSSPRAASTPTQFRGSHVHPPQVPYGPSSFISQQEQCQPTAPQTPHTPHGVSHTADPEHIIKQISKGVMPDQSLLRDKKVLHILRSSLEEKEAKLYELQEAARRKERQRDRGGPEMHKKYSHHMQSKMYGHLSKSGLPPFGAVAERMCTPPSFLGGKLNVSHSGDTVKIDIEPTQNYLGLGIEKGGAGNAGMPVPDDGLAHPDLDGLAAFLAARIRTKAELKQVGPTIDSFRVPVPHFPSREHPSSDNRPQVSSISPPKLTREGRLIPPPPPRRRLLSHTAEDEIPSQVNTVSEERPVPVRDPSGLRSSSETSVFDFRESDSEGEMPVLERQTLEEMRRDRKTFGSKQNISLPPPDDHERRNSTESLKLEPEIKELNTLEPDPFWDTTCDMFVEQLQKRPPKRSVRKKKIAPRLHVNLDTRGLDANSNDRSQGSIAEDSFDENDKLRCSIKKELSDEESRDNIEEEVRHLEIKVEKIVKDIGGHEVEKRLPLSAAKIQVKREDLDAISKPFQLAEVRVELDKRLVDKGTTKYSKIEKEPNRNENKIDHSHSDFNDQPEMKKESPQLKRDLEKTKSKEKGKKESDGILSELKSKEKDLKKEEPVAKSKVGKPDLKSVRIVRKGCSTGKVDPTVKSEVATPQDDTDTELFDLKSDSDSTPADEEQSSTPESDSSDFDSSDSSDSSSDFASDDDSDNEKVIKRRMQVQTRMQTRSGGQRATRTTGMKLRSKKTAPNKSSTKNLRAVTKRKRDDSASSRVSKKKAGLGEGRDMTAGWQEELYKFKRSLRMPEKLINISRPQRRATASLPDLDAFPESLDSVDLCFKDKSASQKEESDEDSEVDTRRGRKKKNQDDLSSQDSDTALTTIFSKQKNGRKSQSSSLLNMLNKYGKGEQKKTKNMKERKAPRVLPKATDKPELLPTPSLGIGKENVLKDKKKVKEGKKSCEESDSIYLGYFRRKTVNSFKEAFKEKGGLVAREFDPVVLKSRTRTQTRDLKKRVTIREVFGDDRPASAPPLSCREVTGSDEDSEDKTEEKKKKQVKMVKKSLGMVTRGKVKLKGGRPGLRSAAFLRSNKAVQISKRHLNSGRNRNMDLLRIRALTSKKFSELHGSSETSALPITKKRLKLRSVRRKFRSGFDYIRKKKKLKKDGDSIDGSVKEKKLVSRTSSENVEDLQMEIKSWMINKGLGETVLHRAARLGYTDVAAYCLEKMETTPSPRDNAGYTPLHEACSRGHLDIAKLLLMYGASVSESARGGIRPLHEAAENGYTELIRLLLSYGADPLLETYTGHTALSLVTDEEARRLMQHHLADVQGNMAPGWTFRGPSTLFDPEETGCNPLTSPPSPTTSMSDVEFEACDTPLPPLYRLSGGPESERWVLLRDLSASLKSKLSKDELVSKEMKLSDFLEQTRCMNLLGSGQRPITKPSKVVLVRYDERVRALLGVERTIVHAASPGPDSL